MITLKKIIEKLNPNAKLDTNPAMTNKDLIHSDLESEKAKALGQNNYHQFLH